MDRRLSVVYGQAFRGEVPAERLDRAERDRLVRVLHGYGWSDVEIAEHTWMTVYTTARIRIRLGLGRNE